MSQSLQLALRGILLNHPAPVQLWGHGTDIKVPEDDLLRPAASFFFLLSRWGDWICTGVSVGVRRC